MGAHRAHQHRGRHIPRTDTVQRPFLDRLIEEGALCDVFTRNAGRLTGRVMYFTDSYLLFLPHGEQALTLVYKTDINNIRPQAPFKEPLEKPIRNPPRRRKYRTPGDRD